MSPNGKNISRAEQQKAAANNSATSASSTAKMVPAVPAAGGEAAPATTKLRGYLQVKHNPTTRRSRLPRKVRAKKWPLYVLLIKKGTVYVIVNGFHVTS